eukprot:TRINITY_DN29901_c0_g1_i2.p2 TRINITY_DN29901_c0_g1~~TRINITY_DN29901_c0_g1_i2.p2  ORF type:complete len:206 (+),score=24.45 TRINITY_DN29901_c0_g1_i2:29-619(+)
MYTLKSQVVLGQAPIKQYKTSNLSPRVVLQKCTGVQFQEKTLTQGQVIPDWEIRMLYDGECPLCKREVDFLMERDSQNNKIDFVDFTQPEYSPEDNSGITYEQAMKTIHGILPDGSVVTDIEVFRRLYEAVGLGWVYAITKNKAIENVANVVYGFWAKNRMQITGRPGLEVILEKRRTEGKMCADDATECELPNLY